MKSVKTKLFLIITCISLIPLIITNFYFYRNLTETLQENTVKSLDESLTNLAKRTHFYMQTIETYSYTISKDAALISALKNATTVKEEDHAESFQQFRDASKTFFLRVNFMNSIISNLSNCYLYKPEESVFMDNNLTFYTGMNPEYLPFYQTLSNNHYQDSWEFTKTLDFPSLFHNNTHNSKNALSYLTTIYANQQPLACLSINLQCTYFAETFQSLSKQTGGNLLVYMGNQLISSTDEIKVDFSDTVFKKAKNPEKKYSGSFQLKNPNASYLAVYHYMDEYDMTFIYLLQDSVYLGNITQIMPNVILLCIILLVLLFILCIYISNMFYTPIKPLLKVMEDVQNNRMQTRITHKRNDEYQKIYTGFNNMMDEVNSLIDRLVISTSLQKDSQIKLLQAQMNPHFIYNTLESIYSLAKIHGEEEIANVIESLSSFYRFSLSGGASEITLRQAVSMTEHYLNIQNFRFDNTITCEIRLEPGLADYPVPKFAIQAIVENSIYHGIEPSNHPGYLTIDAYSQDENIIIKIKDNGIGIKNQELEALKRSIETPFASQLQQQEAENFALRNLNQQIKLHYGDSYGLTIESAQNTGTSITITLPCQH